MAGKWLAGVTHAHTDNSDGKLTLEQIIDEAKRLKLDFLIITDHNKNCRQDLPEVDGLTLIYGAEMTYHGGHANVWGVKNAVDDFTCESYEEWLEKKTEAQRRGALVCMNHPLCTKCPWRWEKRIEDFDVLEVWNSIQHYDNMVCTDWWHEQLRAGHKTPIVGGSDYHRDYVVTHILAMPVTYVYAESSSPEDILKAIAAGRTAVTDTVGKTLIELRCGDAMTGDTVSFKEPMSVTVMVKGLKKNHRLAVYDKNGECYSYTAKKTGDFNITVPVKEPGFICADVRRNLSKLYKKAYDIVSIKWVPQQKGIELPPFIYSMSGVMFFE